MPDGHHAGRLLPIRRCAGRGRACGILPAAAEEHGDGKQRDEDARGPTRRIHANQHHRGPQSGELSHPGVTDTGTERLPSVRTV